MTTKLFTKINELMKIIVLFLAIPIVLFGCQPSHKKSEEKQRKFLFSMGRILITGEETLVFGQ